MTGLVALLGGMAVTGAGILLVLGLRGAPPRARRQRQTPAELWARYSRRPPGVAGRRRDLFLAGSIAAGCLIFIFTGWLIAIVLTPVAVAIVPKLLGQAPHSDLALMEALDRWVRTLATTLPVGRDVVQSIRISRAGAPPLIAADINLLVDRLDRRMDPADALQRFADSLDSPESDAVIASLKLATTRTEGLRDNLIGIAESIQERIRALRAIEVERSKPRNTARIVTILSAAMIGAAAVFGRGYFAPYGTPLGQVLIACLGLAYVGSLVLMYRMAVPRKRERILISDRGTT